MMARFVLVFALLGGLLLAPLAQAQRNGDRACDMAATNLFQADRALPCKACCAGAMPCCALSKREAPQSQPQPLSNDDGRGSSQSQQQLLTALAPALLPLFCLLPPQSEQRSLPNCERSAIPFSRALPPALSCIWLI